MLEEAGISIVENATRDNANFDNLELHDDIHDINVKGSEAAAHSLAHEAPKNDGKGKDEAKDQKDDQKGKKVLTEGEELNKAHELMMEHKATRGFEA